MNEFVTLISNVGFPIAACVVLFIQQGKLSNTLSDLSNTLAVMNQRLDDIEKKVTK